MQNKSHISSAIKYKSRFANQKRLRNPIKIVGFTLIECLVALLIIAIVLATTTRAIELSVVDTKDNYLREMAMWVADNEISQIHIDGIYPDLGLRKKEIVIAGVSYLVSINVATTPNAYFRKLDVAVATKDKPDYAIFKTIAFIAQY